MPGRQPNPSPSLSFLDHLDFSQEEVNDGLLLAIEPAGQDHDEQLPKLEDETHGATGVGVGEWDRIEDLCPLSIGPDGHLPVGFSDS